MTELDFINLKNLSIPQIGFHLEEPVPDNLGQLQFMRYVLFDDEIVEWNFRMVESYMPELLYLMGKESDGKPVIKCISKLSRKVCFGTFKFTKLFLKVKMHQLVEALLYGDLFTGTWIGKWHTDRCYVRKDSGELRFYSIYESRQLIRELVNQLTITTNDGKIKLGLL